MQRVLVIFGFWCWMLCGASGWAQSVSDEARAAFNQGQFDRARSALIDQMEDEGHSDERILLYVDTYTAEGAYEEGLEDASRRNRDTPETLHWAYAEGRFLEKLGRLDEAEENFRSVAEQQLEIWPNILALAELFDYRGRRSDAFEVYALFYNPYKNGQFRTADHLGMAGRALGKVGEFRDANAAYNTAYKLEATNVRNLHWWGDLFREKYNDADAIRTLEEGLAANPHIGELDVALARAAGGFSSKEKFARAALDKNPNLVEAHSVLAGLHILDAEFDQARTRLEQALAINPASIEALSNLASVHFLTGDSTAFRIVEERALAINDQGGSFYVTLSKNAELKFRYPDAVRFARMAVERDRRNIPGFAQLGISLLRLGEAEEARRYLDYSFDQDPYNLFVGNTLTLIDEYEDFALLESQHFQLLIHNSERDVLGPAMLNLAEEAYDVLATRYPYDPQGKILLEAYNDADDFAVRIAGVPHLGLLGVSFGDVLALNTPKGLEEGTYNWARTLWHELVHSITIGLSQNKLPRWFAEGLAVFEERRARPEWGREMELELLMAYEQDKLLPLDAMDRGFTRPTFPGQILLSYFHASQIVAYIFDTYGQESLVNILEGYARGLNDEQAFQEATGQSLDALDEAFRGRLDDRRRELAPVLAGMPNPFQEAEGGPGLLERFRSSGAGNPILTALRSGNEALAAEDYATAISRFEEALRLYPDFTESGNAYEGLAAVYKAQQDTAQLISILEQYLTVTEHAVESARLLGELHQEQGRSAPAIQYFARSLDVNPYDRDVHQSLAGLHTQSGNHAAAVRAHQAILDLNPVDRAAVYFALAQSLSRDERPREARRAVLQSLELAPGYLEAQALLLKLTDGASGGSEE